MKLFRLSFLCLVTALLGAIVGTFGPVAILLTFAPIGLLWFMNWDECHYKNYVKKGK